MTRSRWIVLAIAAACLVVAGFVVVPNLGQDDKDCGRAAGLHDQRLRDSPIPLNEGALPPSVAFEC